jgi:hypothetical protein
MGLTAVVSLVLVCTAAAQETVPNDVTATFIVCLEGTGTTGDVCITGNNTALTDWGNGVTMTNTEGDIWTVDVVFPAGTPAAVEYKYRRNACEDWENDPNRQLTLPTDGTDAITVDPESFNRVAPIGCGFSAPLDQDVTVCFQVCLEGVAYMGDNCVIGNIPALGEWGTGLTMRQVGPDLFQRCLTFPAGTLVPMEIQYKFQKDNCTEWESVGGGPFDNRMLTLTASSPVAQTIRSPWSDGPSTCTAVANDQQSWSTLKSNFRD